VIEIKVTLYAPRGGFDETTFTEWIGHQIQVTGLDPSCRQVLTVVENTEDGKHSTLTVQIGREEGPELAANLSVIMGTPKAKVHAVHHDSGDHITDALLDAPLQPGQPVLVNGQPHLVVDTSWPAREETCAAGENEDRQHVTLQRVDVPPEVFSLGAIPQGLAGIAAFLK
jgi:hypothetical protein